jgi:hypothetical protein
MTRATIIEIGARALHDSLRRAYATDAPDWDAAPEHVRVAIRGDVEAVIAALEAAGVKVGEFGP